MSKQTEIIHLVVGGAGTQPVVRHRYEILSVPLSLVETRALIQHLRAAMVELAGEDPRDDDDHLNDEHWPVTIINR